MKKILNLIPDINILNKLIVYLTSIYFHKSLTFYFSQTLNGYMLRHKTSSDNISKYVDKINAKIFLKEKLGSRHTIETLGEYEFSEKKIPNRPWAFKSNNDFSGALLFSNGVLSDAKKIVLKRPIINPSKGEIHLVIENFIKQKNLDAFKITREACYKNISTKYFFEELIPSYKIDGSPLNEYKFHMINGEIEFIYVVIDRLGINKRIIIDKDGNPLKVTWCKPVDLHKFLESKFKISNNFKKMSEVAKKLSSNFKYVRVDIYDSDYDIKVGELTFFHGSGLEQIKPIEYDYILGKKLIGI